MRSDGYHAVTLLDLENPLPPAWLQSAGVDYLYASAPPVEASLDGAPVIAESHRERWEHALRLYEDAGIQLLLMGGFYIDPAEGHQAVDAFGRRHQMACFRNSGFQAVMTERVVALTTAFSAYPAFGGFVFDDGPHVRVDCCYCPACREQFTDLHNISPPKFKPRAMNAYLPDDDPILLWEQFQQESWQIYLRTQSDAVRSVSDDLLMLTIPSDSYFYGRFLNVRVNRSETKLGHGGRLQRIERIQPRRWGIFQSFPLARLPEADEAGLQPWAVGAHITADSPKMLLQCRGPYAPTYERIQYMSPGEIERMTRVTITEGANSICYWAPAASLRHYPGAFDAFAEVYRDVQKIEDMLARRRPTEANVGLLYSTTTETMEQPWETETSERWRHLHAYEGLSYALSRSNIPFEAVMEDDLTSEKLSRFDALVLPATGWLTAGVTSMIETAVAREGLRAFAAGECVPIRGAIASACDPLIWHNHAGRGYRQEQYADEQWEDFRRTLSAQLEPLIDAPVRVYSEHVIGKLYDLDDGDRMLLIANWGLDDLCEVAIEGEGRAIDMLSGRELNEINELRRLTLPPAGWRVIRITR